MIPERFMGASSLRAALRGGPGRAARRRLRRGCSKWVAKNTLSAAYWDSVYGYDEREQRRWLRRVGGRLP